MCAGTSSSDVLFLTSLQRRQSKYQGSHHRPMNNASSINDCVHKKSGSKKHMHKAEAGVDDGVAIEEKNSTLFVRVPSIHIYSIHRMPCMYCVCRDLFRDISRDLCLK